MAVSAMDPVGNLRSDIQQALQCQRLTTWQRSFLTNIHSRLERSQGQARLSDKQWKKLFEIFGRQSYANGTPSPKISGGAFLSANEARCITSK